MCEYEKELDGIVPVPAMLSTSLLDFARKIRVTIETEQAKPLPDQDLIALLSDAARLGSEYLCFTNGLVERLRDSL